VPLPSTQKNARVLLGEVTRVDLANHRILVDGDPLDHDYLILAVGATNHCSALRDRNGVEVPGPCPAAIQEGRFVARTILRELAGRPREPFAYLDKGTMATVGRSRAIARVGKLELSGMPAWLAWMGVHVLFLIGFERRFIVMFAWMWPYLTFKRGARLITGHVQSRASAGKPLTPVEGVGVSNVAVCASPGEGARSRPETAGGK
jgi:NADH dehydrogenase FAD-containing subunit